MAGRKMTENSHFRQRLPDRVKLNRIATVATSIIDQSRQLMLKIIAILMMTADHANRILFMNEYHLLTAMGRFAFPLFAFMIARNGLYTRNSAKYIGLLFLFGVLSQPIYAWALNHEWLQPLNVLFTLGLGLLAVRAWLAGYWWALPLIIASGWFVDYGMEGVAVMPVIAFIIQSINKRGFWHLLTILGFGILIALSYRINASSYAANVIAAFALGFMTLLPQLDAVEKKLRWPNFRLFFYGFYPCHLILLALISHWLQVRGTDFHGHPAALPNAGTDCVCPLYAAR